MTQPERTHHVDKTRRFVRLFKPRFAPLVEQGKKLHTIRPVPKRMPRPGDRISLREWTGKPYRSKQRELRPETDITRVQDIVISRAGVRIDGEMITNFEKVENFANADGFDTGTEMVEWFETTHGLPFTGILTHWPKL